MKNIYLDVCCFNSEHSLAMKYSVVNSGGLRVNLMKCWYHILNHFVAFTSPTKPKKKIYHG